MDEPSTDTRIYRPSQLLWLTGNKIKDYSTWSVFLSIINLFSLKLQVFCFKIVDNRDKGWLFIIKKMVDLVTKINDRKNTKTDVILVC